MTQTPVKYTPPRIPYDPRLEEKFGIGPSFWRLLCEQVFPAAKTPDGILLAVAYCRERKLDILKRPVHVVPIWDSSQGKEIESVWPGIAEIRTTATRTKLYAGKDKADFGPMKTHTFEGTTKKGGLQKIEVTFPEWCQITVYKMVEGHRIAFEGPRVYWMETYSTMGKSDLPNSMWQKRPSGQLEKCTEAAALRAAFPEELGNEYIAEEATGTLMRDVTPPPRPKQEDFADTDADTSTVESPPKAAEDSRSQVATGADESRPQESENPAPADDGFPGDQPTGYKPPVIKSSPTMYADIMQAVRNAPGQAEALAIIKANSAGIAKLSEEQQANIDEAAALKGEA